MNLDCVPVTCANSLQLAQRASAFNCMPFGAHYNLQRHIVDEGSCARPTAVIHWNSVSVSIMFAYTRSSYAYVERT